MISFPLNLKSYFLTSLIALLYNSTACYATTTYSNNVPVSSAKCENFTSGISEHLRSPGYPNNYFENLDCRKVIKAGPQFTVVLKFLIFHLEASRECKYDFIEIRDGMYGFSPLLYKGCGDDIRQGRVFESTSQHMWIRFVSDAQISRKGFLAKISATPKTEGLTGTSNYFECYKVIEDVTSFELGYDTLPIDFWKYHKQNPTKPIHCVWDIRMPEPSKVFVRITNYSVSHITTQCDSNYLESYDQTTASSDIRRVDCIKPYSGWISGSSRALLHLYSHSFSTMPKFSVIGNIYMENRHGNCSGDSTFNCFDGYCIPSSLRCDNQENCSEGYDEDCSVAVKSPRFQAKYIILFVVVVVGCLLLTTMMTIAEVIQKRKQAKKEKAQKKSSNEVIVNIGSRSSARSSSQSIKRDQSVDASRDHCSTTTADSIGANFRNSRLNENVSFRKARTPTSLPGSRYSEDRLYQTPNISLPSHTVIAEIPPAPPSPLTPPPPPAPPQEGRGFRLIYDLTNLGKSATATFEYPPPPSFLRRADSHRDEGETSTIADYTSTSSSSFDSLPRVHSYDVACMERRKGKPSPNAVKLTDIPAEATRLLSPANPNKFKSRSGQAPKCSPPQAPGTTKRSWTFDDDTDDGAMELTTFISTC